MEEVEYQINPAKRIDYGVPVPMLDPLPNCYIWLSVMFMDRWNARELWCYRRVSKGWKEKIDRHLAQECRKSAGPGDMGGRIYPLAQTLMALKDQLFSQSDLSLNNLFDFNLRLFFPTDVQARRLLGSYLDPVSVIHLRCGADFTWAHLKAHIWLNIILAEQPPLWTAGARGKLLTQVKYAQLAWTGKQPLSPTIGYEAMKVSYGWDNEEVVQYVRHPAVPMYQVRFAHEAVPAVSLFEMDQQIWENEEFWEHARVRMLPIPVEGAPQRWGVTVDLMVDLSSDSPHATCYIDDTEDLSVETTFSFTEPINDWMPLHLERVVEKDGNGFIGNVEVAIKRADNEVPYVQSQSVEMDREEIHHILGSVFSREILTYYR